VIVLAELPHRLQAVVPVRRPIALGVADDDQRIEKASDFLDDGHQPFHVRLRRVALIRCRLDRVDRQGDEQDGRPAERIVIRPEHCTAIVLDAGSQLANLARLSSFAHLAGGEAD
jgi:hypothetical protein